MLFYRQQSIICSFQVQYVQLGCFSQISINVEPVRLLSSVAIFLFRCTVCLSPCSMVLIYYCSTHFPRFSPSILLPFLLLINCSNCLRAFVSVYVWVWVCGGVWRGGISFLSCWSSWLPSSSGLERKHRLCGETWSSHKLHCVEQRY